MSKSGKTWILRFVKIAIAVVGLWWVVTKTPWNDVVTVPGDGSTELLSYKILEPVDLSVLGEGPPVTGPSTTRSATMAARPAVYHVRLPNRAVKVADAAGHVETVKLVKVLDDGSTTREIDIDSDKLEKVSTGETQVQVGLRNLILRANPAFLLAAWAVLVLPFLITSWRWMKLMQPQGIFLPYSKCLALTFVGQFYSTFLPGITGGDLVKIIYASQVTGSKTKSTVTVLLDRVIGLVALLMIAGVAATLQYFFGGDELQDPVSKQAIRNVALLSCGILGGLAIGTALYFSRRVRVFLAIDRLTESAKDRLAARAAARERGEDVPEEATGEIDSRSMRNIWRIVGIVQGLFLAAGLFVVFRAVLKEPEWSAWKCLGLAAAVGAGETLIWILCTPRFAAGSPLVGKLWRTKQRVAEVVVQFDGALHAYRGHMGILAMAFGVSVAAQLTLPLSAYLAGQAFGMKAPLAYYFAFVPLALIAASIPVVPPGGIGVTESIFLHFFVERGPKLIRASAGQSFALAQAVRFLPIAWNMVGAWWVVTGKYSRHQAVEETKQDEAEMRQG